MLKQITENYKKWRQWVRTAYQLSEFQFYDKEVRRIMEVWFSATNKLFDIHFVNLRHNISDGINYF